MTSARIKNSQQADHEYRCRDCAYAVPCPDFRKVSDNSPILASCGYREHKFLLIDKACEHFKSRNA